MNPLDRFHLKHPIIQAPMAGVTTAEFVAACTESGMLGSIGAGYLDAASTRNIIRAVRQLTDKPFSVNLFVPDEPVFDQQDVRRAYEALQPIGEQLGLPFWKAPLSEPEFDGQLQVVLEEKPAVCSFTFGLPSMETMQALRQAGILTIGTATTLEEAAAVQSSGMDMAVLQGSESGGHRGSFAPGGPLVPLDDLLQQAAGSLEIPLIAAGGIMSASRMRELLHAGACAVQIGTVLLAAEESGAAPAYKQAVQEAADDRTVITSVFSGRPARGIRNTFIDRMDGAPLAPYPFQNDLTKRLRKEAAARGDAEYMSLWAGTGVSAAGSGTAAELLSRFLDS
ncbi:NAD(P)H-dependent flavin oxidoreductase [Sporosarcina trichiuri]|uniref:NAD(P)H-dependent flavin oxidoreductase n=1 Tax=Sporosarcina trichiuri TaxID=3056445 RepID=UPI0025B3A8E5|nr:nitronate monooxygenase [Sporosarcina sp. 0.2-SM1T-5]WJY27079.1 nitronate monooxygenase [Sporosarcina sp. 0.2-SM1T-5]